MSYLDNNLAVQNPDGWLAAGTRGVEAGKREIHQD
jgi:hypothetical protein